MKEIGASSELKMSEFYETVDDDRENFARLMPAVRQCREEWVIESRLTPGWTDTHSSEFIAYLAETWGIQLVETQLEGSHGTSFLLPEFKIVDEKRYTMFILRWM